MVAGGYRFEKSCSFTIPIINLCTQWKTDRREVRVVEIYNTWYNSWRKAGTDK